MSHHSKGLDTGHRAAGSRPADTGPTVEARSRFATGVSCPSSRFPSRQSTRSASTGGPRRLRAIGFYALPCQLANEQRHIGEHRVINVTYDVLAERDQMSKRSVKLLLDALEIAGVLRYERHNDRATGAVVSRLHLLVHDGPMDRRKGWRSCANPRRCRR